MISMIYESDAAFVSFNQAHEVVSELEQNNPTLLGSFNFKCFGTLKVADVHELTAEHNKYGGTVIIEYLVNIVNFNFKTNDIPDIIKMGILTPVLKKLKDPSNA